MLTRARTSAVDGCNAPAAPQVSPNALARCVAVRYLTEVECVVPPSVALQFNSRPHARRPFSAQTVRPSHRCARCKTSPSWCWLWPANGLSRALDKRNESNQSCLVQFRGPRVNEQRSLTWTRGPQRSYGVRGANWR